MIGTLAVFWRGTDQVPEDGVIGALEELARTSAPAIRNAQKFRLARQLADVDGLTSLHNRRYFHETLARETARAQRYERRLALVILDVDDFKETNDRLGHLGGDAVLAAVAERLLSAVRRADIACRVGGDEFAVILPEAGARDAEQLYQRIQFAIGSGAAGPAENVRVSAGIAELTARGRRDLALRARRRSPVPREGRRQGPGAQGGRLDRLLAGEDAAGLETGAGAREILLAAPDEHADVLEEAGAVGLQLVGEEVPGRGRIHLLLMRAHAGIRRDHSRYSPPRCGSCG